VGSNDSIPAGKASNCQHCIVLKGLSVVPGDCSAFTQAGNAGALTHFAVEHPAVMENQATVHLNGRTRRYEWGTASLL
jgi:hypothetical protein